MRLHQEGGSDLVGNFQCGQSDYSTVTVWHEAKAAICVARGFLYLVPYARPPEYEAHEGTFSAVVLSPSGATLYAVDSDRVLAFGLDLRIRWKREEEVWEHGSCVVLDRVEDGAILVSAQFDLDGPWTRYVLAEHDGKLVAGGT